MPKIYSRRYLYEYLVFIAVAVIAFVLGIFSSSLHLPPAHEAKGQYSFFEIFGGNVLVILGVFLAGLLSGGLAGAIIIFLNLFLYGRFLHIYTRASTLVALFPWLEFISLVIAAQVGANIFWSLMFNRTIRLRIILFLLLCCVVLLLIAAFIEGDILYV